MKRLEKIGVALGAAVTLASAAALEQTRSSPMRPLAIDLETNPDLQFRIDNFDVPDAARAEFEAAMRRNLAFLETLPGFLGHVVFEKSGGPTTFNVVTIAVWKSPEAMQKAGEQVRAYYQKIGFDMPAMIAKWGVTAQLGNYHAPRRLQ
jgi:heme-degrading monooxygenase HmoA